MKEVRIIKDRKLVKLSDDKGLHADLIEKQKSKGTYDSPCMSICNYKGVFKECGTCFMRKAEKNIWKTAKEDMKECLLRSIEKRPTD